MAQTVSVIVRNEDRARLIAMLRKRIYHTIEELQRDLDAWLAEYNEVRSHQGRWCYSKTPMQTFLSSLPLAQEKVLQPQ